jgi:YD repeat-containing protein
LQLIGGSASLTVTAADGTTMLYSKINNEFRCMQIEDRNGNLITVARNQFGNITTITDTANRVITFGYDANDNLISITQTWNGSVTHTWATFGWSSQSLGSGFPSSMQVVGTNGSETVAELASVSLDDGTNYVFNYMSYGQVSQIVHFGPVDPGHQRGSITYSYDSPAATNDCPRITYRQETEEYWNSAVTTAYGAAVAGSFQQYLAGGGGLQSASGSYNQVNMPDGTSNRIWTRTTGFDRGLPRLVETFDSSGTLQRSAMTDWANDTASTYPVNPHVVESNVVDLQNNRARTAINYLTPMSLPNGTVCNLPSDVIEYNADAAGYLRRTHTDYVWDATNYLNRNIVGLVSDKYVDDGYGAVAAKVDYQYDQGSLSGLTAPTQHDDYYFGTGFVVGRGNVTTTRRWDANAPTSSFLAQTVAYNTAGAPVSSTDPVGHMQSVDYTDNPGGSTYAYPTKVTDADGNASSMTYRYDIGRILTARTPNPSDPSPQPIANGPTVTTGYDTVGRVLQVSNGNATTTYNYYANYLNTFSTLNDTNTAPALSTKIFDGAGRVVVAGSDNPTSASGYKAQHFVFDIMGRQSEASNPAETDSSFNPAGLDATGWIYSTQTYDWKGRALRTTNADNTFRTLDYTGCGCAGGQVATMTDEVGRKQRVTQDVLGRTKEVDVANSDESWSYSTTTNTYDLLDHVTHVTQVDVLNNKTQDTVMKYEDGYGRRTSQQAPQQTSASLYTYNTDDTPNVFTDARGATTTFSNYNGRHQAGRVVYNVSGSNIQVDYTYDAAGNRMTMAETQSPSQPGNGSTTYSYDQLSRLTSEQRYFNGLGGSFTLNYGYNLSGQLQHLTDPFGSEIDYTRDKIGEITAVNSPQPYAGVTNYVNNATYRAWGGLNSAAFGNGTAVGVTVGNTASVIIYNNRMQLTHYQLLNSDGSDLMNENYGYYNDGRLQQVTDLDDTAGADGNYHTWRYMSRGYSYDQAGRVASAAPAPGNPSPIPFNQTYGYDAFNNLTSHYGTVGYYSGTMSDPATYTNNLRDGWSYDADGRLLISPANAASNSNEHDWSYDAAGRLASTTDQGAHLTYTATYDGDGQIVYETGVPVPTTDYLIHSTVLGGAVVTKLDGAGAKRITYVPAGGMVLPLQEVDQSVGPLMAFIQRNPQGVTEVGSASVAAAYDALGNFVPFQTLPPTNTPPPGSPGYGPSYGGGGTIWGNASDFAYGCTVNGAPANCDLAMTGLNHETVPWIQLWIGTGSTAVGLEPVTSPANVPGSAHTGQNGSPPDSSTTVYGGVNSTGSGGTEDPASVVSVNFAPDYLETSIYSLSVLLPQNPNCISNAVAGGTIGTRRVIMAAGAVTGQPPYGTDLSRNAHDGIHVLAPPGRSPVTELPAMAGSVLHYGYQTTGGPGDYSILDILMNTRIDGQQYVLTLKDMLYVKGAYHNRSPITSGENLGTVIGGDDVGESGLHVTLMSLATYNKYINGNFSSASRSSVPYNRLMDAAHDPRSPFKCP